MRAWTRGVATVAGLELRQRVRSRRWWVVLVVWFVLVGAFTLLMVNATLLTDDGSAGPLGLGGGAIQPYCDTGVILSDDGTAVDGCQLDQPPVVALGTLTADTVVYSQPVCSADENGTVRCDVVQWSTLGGATCTDTGTGPTCIRYDPNAGNVQVDGPPKPDLGFACTNDADGSAVCRLPATVDQTDGTVVQPPQTCTIRYDPGSGRAPHYSASCAWGPVDGWTPSSGPMVFAFVVFFVLGLGLLVTPALTAGSINGDRHAGTLATLQATTLSATQIALGKLVAAWLTVAAFLVASLPWLGVATVTGGISVFQVLGCCVVLMLELAVMCAVGLGWSALVSRVSGSNLLSYLTAVTLSVLTVVFVALLEPLTTRDTQVDVWRLPDDVQARWDAEYQAYVADPEAFTPPAMPTSECEWFTETRSEAHTERTWWLLVPNPFLMVADAAPEPEIARTHRTLYSAFAQDPLFDIREQVASLAAGPDPQVDECVDYGWGYLSSGSAPTSPVEYRDPSSVRVWPWSLAANLVLGGSFFAVAVRRLKVPYHKLPKGTRVA